MERGGLIIPELGNCSGHVVLDGSNLGVCNRVPFKAWMYVRVSLCCIVSGFQPDVCLEHSSSSKVYVPVRLRSLLLHSFIINS
jgi:hypothetical protein